MRGRRGVSPIDNGGPSAFTVSYKYNFGHASCEPPAAIAAFQGIDKSHVARWANELDGMPLMSQLKQYVISNRGA